MEHEVKLMQLTRLHLMSGALHLAGLLLVLAQAFWFVPPQQSDHRVLVLTLCVVPAALVVFLLVPRRAGLKRESTVPQRSFLVYMELGSPVVLTLLTLSLVAVNKSYDSFAGFGMVLAVGVGHNLCEWLRNRSP